LRAKFHRRANPRDPEDLVDKCSGLAWFRFNYNHC
jgi:hypothetical protein